MRSPRMPTSARNHGAPVPSTTRPPVKTMSKGAADDAGCAGCGTGAAASSAAATKPSMGSPCEGTGGILEYEPVRVLPLVTLLLAGNVAAAEPPGATAALIAERIARFHGTMGVAAIDLGGSGETLAVGAERRFPTASIIKLAVLVEAFQQVEGGTLRLDQLVTVEPADRVGDGGIVDRIHQGASLSLQDLLNLMIRLSDNSATNAVVRLVGTAKVDERLAAYGLKDTLLFRPTFRDGHPDVHPELEKEFGLGMTTPRDIAALMAKIGRGEAVSPAASKAMLEILEGQEDKLMIYRGLPHAATRARSVSRARPAGTRRSSPMRAASAATCAATSRS